MGASRIRRSCAERLAPLVCALAAGVIGACAPAPAARPQLAGRDAAWEELRAISARMDAERDARLAETWEGRVRLTMRPLALRARRCARHLGGRAFYRLHAAVLVAPGGAVAETRMPTTVILPPAGLAACLEREIAATPWPDPGGEARGFAADFEFTDETGRTEPSVSCAEIAATR